MTDQPVEPRERETEQNPAVTTPQPDPEPGDKDDAGNGYRTAVFCRMVRSLGSRKVSQSGRGHLVAFR